MTSPPRVLLLVLALAAAAAGAACSLFAGEVACDEATPCADGRACGADGFCGHAADVVDAGAPTTDGGAARDAGVADAGTVGPIDAGVVDAPTTTTLERAPAAVALGDEVTLTATVARTAGVVHEGDVAFDVSVDGAAWWTVATAPVDATGVATATDAPLFDGVAYRARYAGTPAFLPSTSTATPTTIVTIPADLAATSTALTPAIDVASVGDEVALAVVVRDGAGAPAGAGTVSVQTLRGGDVWRTELTAPLDASGELALAWTADAPGLVQLRALYGGADGFAPSLSPATPAITVTSPTHVAATRAPAAAAVGAPITLTAVVRAPDAAGAPVTTGLATLQRSADGVAWTDVATGALDDEGTYATTYVAVAPGSLVFRATYAGDGLLAPSTSAPTEPTSIARPTSTTLTRDPPSVTLGDAVTLHAVVSADASAVTSGSVAFDASTDDGATWTQLGVEAVAAGGAADRIDHPSRDGTVYRARFLGDGDLSASTSATTAPVAVAVPAGVAATTTTLTRDPDAVAVGAQVSLQATVAAPDAGVAVGDGDVTVQWSPDGVLWQDVAQGAVDAAGGFATTHAPSAPGSIRYRASYAGGSASGATFGPSTSAVTDPTTVSAGTTTTVARSPATVRAGSNVTVTATVTDALGAAVTSGDVVLERSSDGGAWAAIATHALDGGGQATATHAPGAESTVVYRARYLGTASYTGSTSADSAATTVQHKVAKTKTWTATWSRTYFGGGGQRTDPEFMYFCIQGQFSSNNGNQKCAFGFDDANIRATLAGATIVDAKLYLYWDHWAVAGSHNAFIGTHRSSNATAMFGALAGLNTNRRQESFAENQGKTFSVGRTIGEDFRDDDARGFTLGPAPTTAQSSYGYAAGAEQANPPRLTIEYEVWE